LRKDLYHPRHKTAGVQHLLSDCSSFTLCKRTPCYGLRLSDVAEAVTGREKHACYFLTSWPCDGNPFGRWGFNLKKFKPALA
jgi:hypothetical protein